MRIQVIKSSEQINNQLFSKNWVENAKVNKKNAHGRSKKSFGVVGWLFINTRMMDHLR